ncbi:MAG: hypothetical protein HOI76_02510 [Microbacteriaceae bacterium]|mgnify:CR=1 FL=1|nr:hypothetical protein [Microbacteriaceae bacterium]
MGLSASPEDQAKLLDVADTDLALARAHTTLKGLAAALHLDTLDAAIDEIKGRRHDAFIELESIRSELARAESDVSLVDARIAQDSQRLEHTSSAKDALGLEHELESLRTRRSNLEDIELAIMEKLEAAEAGLAGIDAELATAEAALLEARDEEARRSEALHSEIRVHSDARAALIASLPRDLVELYERQRERYGVGASHLRFGVSGASGVKLTESDIHNIRQTPADAVILCPDSNAILVRTAESGL